MNDEYLTSEIGPEIKRVTLHPLDAEGNPDTEVNLYPKTLLDGIVNREGNEVDVALKEDLPTSDDFVTLDTDQVIGGYKRFSSTLRVGDEIQPQILIDGNSSDINIFKDTMNYITYDVEGIHGCINEGSQNCNLTFPKKTGVLATTSDIPTNYVTIDTNQIITGNKSLAPNTQVIFDSEHKKHLISNNNGDISIVRVDNSGNYHGVLHISSDGEFHEGKETITLYGDLVRYEDNDTATIGDIIKPFKNIYLNGKINENYSGYGLKAPQTWDWNEDKEIATKDEAELVANKVTSLSSSSTDDQYPSAKSVYNYIKFHAENKILVRWEDLKTLRDSKKLVPGAFYHIWDYKASTTQDRTLVDEGFNSHGILLLAVDIGHLSEKGLYCLNNSFFGQEYEIDYCLDNDINRFAWADAVNGKGVIYRMRNPQTNVEFPFDHLGIKITNGALNIFTLEVTVINNMFGTTTTKSIKFRRSPIHDYVNGSTYLYAWECIDKSSYSTGLTDTFNDSNWTAGYQYLYTSRDVISNVMDIQANTFGEQLYLRGKRADWRDRAKLNSVFTTILQESWKLYGNLNVIVKPLRKNTKLYIPTHKFASSYSIENLYIGYDSNDIVFDGNCINCSVGNNCSYIEFLGNSNNFIISNNVQGTSSSPITLPEDDTNVEKKVCLANSKVYEV